MRASGSIQRISQGSPLQRSAALMVIGHSRRPFEPPPNRRLVVQEAIETAQRKLGRNKRQIHSQFKFAEFP